MGLSVKAMCGTGLVRRQFKSKVEVLLHLTWDLHWPHTTQV
jgi:hypothetical protein